MTTKSYHHGDLKSALINAARKSIETQGAESLSLRSLAASIGVSHMAPYAHFKNKKELLQSVATEGFQELIRRLSLVYTDSDDPSRLILLYGAEYLKYATDNPQIYRLMINQVNQQESAEDPNPKDVVSYHLAEVSRQTYRLLRNAFSLDGSDYQTVSLRAQGAWSMVHGLSSLIIDGYIKIPEGMDYVEYVATTAMQNPILQRLTVA